LRSGEIGNENCLYIRIALQSCLDYGYVCGLVCWVKVPMIAEDVRERRYAATDSVNQKIDFPAFQIAGNVLGCDEVDKLNSAQSLRLTGDGDKEACST